MPRVPTYDSFQATPNTLPKNEIQGAVATPVQDVAGPQAQQLGQSLQQAGGQMARVALDMQREANLLRVDDALNQTKEAALRFTYDKDAGFTKLKGIDALERPSGKPLAEEYGDSLQEQINKVAAGLGNEEQRRVYLARANDIALSMRGQALQHEAQEYKTYALSVADGVQATAMRDISLNWNNPDAVASAVDRVKAETYRQAQLLGKSAEWQGAQARKLTSSAHRLAVAAALENNDPVYADGYLKKFSKEMDADDILAVRGHITKEVDLKVAGIAATNVLQRHAPRIHSSEAERAFNIALGTESNHRQFDDAGKPLTSPKGAIGIAQVMPATAPEAAKLASLPWDEHRYKNDPAYNRALGLAYFQKQLQDFGGDLAQAYAAYNGGPGRLQATIAKHGANWLAHMPEETRNYVAKNMREFAAGKGKATPPTLAELKADLQADPTLANNPTRLKAATTVLESQYKDMQAARKQADDQAVDAVLRELYANGGRLDAVPATMRAALPGDKLGAAIDFAEKVAKNGGAVHSPEAWATIMSLPRDQLAAMTPLDFYTQFRPVLDDVHLEKGYALIADAQGTVDDKHLEIITTATRIKDAAIIAGLIPEKGTPDKKQLQVYGQFTRTIDDRVRQFEKTDLAGKRKANSQELQQIIDTVLVDKAFANEWFSDPSLPVAVMSPEQLKDAYVEVAGKAVKLNDIPTSQRATIASKLQARGLPITEQRIAELWVAAGRPQ